MLCVGLIQLCLSYYESVIAVYQNVMQTHIVGLIVTIILMAGFSLFILWPFVSACRAEGRRIADLLSQIPSDIDIEGLVKRALAGSQPTGITPSSASNGAMSNKPFTASFQGEGSGGGAQQPADGSFVKPGKGKTSSRRGSMMTA